MAMLGHPGVTPVQVQVVHHGDVHHYEDPPAPPDLDPELDRVLKPGWSAADRRTGYARWKSSWGSPHGGATMIKLTMINHP